MDWFFQNLIVGPLHLSPLYICEYFHTSFLYSHFGILALFAWYVLFINFLMGVFGHHVKQRSCRRTIILLFCSFNKRSARTELWCKMFSNLNLVGGLNYSLHYVFVWGFFNSWEREACLRGGYFSRRSRFLHKTAGNSLIHAKLQAFRHRHW